MLNLSWSKCGDDSHWCSFEHVTLNNPKTLGVYIIWHEGNPGRVVKVGQGIVADRIAAHRKDPAITKYQANGTLRVTWASVARPQLDGVERYLADKWSPLVGEAYPIAVPIAVNSPF